jgi:catalase (peroxidase I)
MSTPALLLKREDKRQERNMFRKFSATRAMPLAGQRAFATCGAPAASKTIFGSFARGTGMGLTGVAASTFVMGTTTFCYWAGTPAEASAKPTFDYKGAVADIKTLLEDESCGPLLIRLAWHEAGTWHAKQGDGSANSASMRFAPECMHGANAGLHKARDLLEPIKAKHPKLSYADLWSLAACVAVSEAGGPDIKWRFGRKDAESASQCAPDGRLPDAAQTQDHIREVFNRMGFQSDREIVALIGAHTLGECHADRSGYVGPWTHDRLGFDNTFFTELIDQDWIVNKDIKQLQFKDAATGKLMMLPGDMALIVDPKFRVICEEFAKDGDAFDKQFATSFQKLMELGGHTLFVPKP